MRRRGYHVRTHKRTAPKSRKSFVAGRDKAKSDKVGSGYFKLKTKILRDYLRMAGSIADEVVVDVDGAGWHTIHMDPSKIALMSLDLMKNKFETYKSPNLSFAIDLRSAIKAVEDMGPDTNVHVQKDEVIFKSTMMSFTVKRIVPRAATTSKIPTIDGIPFKVSKKNMLSALRKSEKFGNHVVLLSDNKGFRLVVEGDDGVFEYTIDTITKPNRFKTTYNIEYIVNHLKENPNEELTLYVSDNKPLKIEAMGEIKVKFYLAPRIVTK